MNSIDKNARIAQIHEASTPGTLVQLGPTWWGFDGLHGGWALSLLIAAMRDRSQGRVLRKISGRFRRALRDAFTLEVHEHPKGKTVSWLDADAVQGGHVAVIRPVGSARPFSGGVEPELMAWLGRPHSCALCWIKSTAARYSDDATRLAF